MSSTNDPSKNAREEGKASAFAWIERLVNVDPVQMVSDVWDALDMWRATRRWSAIQMMIPGLVLFFSCFVTICFGMLSSNTKKLDRYIKKADTVAPIQDGMTEEERKAATKKATSETGDITKLGSDEEDDSPQAKARKKAEEEEEAKNIAYADLLFRRVLQLEPNNKMAKFFVAYNLGVRGNVDQARGMMQGLAPPDVKGYPRAHGWVAMDMYNQIARGGKPDIQELLHHLSIAAEHPQTSALLLSVYAQLLEREGKHMEGISIMQRAAQRDNAFYLPLSAMQTRHNQPIQAKESAETAVRHYKRSFGNKDEPDLDRVKAAEAYIQANNFDEAINVLQEGLRLREDRPLLRRALSNVFRYRYRSQLKSTKEGKIEANLGLLNSAMLADPTNPTVGEEIAILQTLGVTADDEMIQALKNQLSFGGATAVTHLLLGNACMNKEDTQNAIVHWKLALGQDSNLVLAINNLAVVYSMLTPPNFDESLRLIDRAIEISRGYPEFLDSKGEILMRAGRFEEAISFLEKAIEGDPARISTREKLVTCYEQLKMMELADKHNNMIAKIREFYKEKGLNERGQPMTRRLPTQSTNENAKGDTKSKEPAIDFDKQLLPSQRGDSSPEK